MARRRNPYIIPTPHLLCSSAFSSAGIVLDGYQKAGFTIASGLDLDVNAARIFDANYKAPDGSPIINFGEPDKPVDVTIVSGGDIRRFLIKKFGFDVIALLEQGPSCQDYSPLNTSGDKGRREMMLQALRLIEETLPLTAVIEESPRFLAKKHKDISEPYFDMVKKLPYRSAYKLMNSVHYGSRQKRLRFIHLFVREDLNIEPIFPEPLTTPIIRARDFLDIDYYLSGHFTDFIRSADHPMCASTSTSPRYFYKGPVKREPTFRELMQCADLDPDKFILVGSDEAKRTALGNLMSPALSYQIGKVIREKILGYNRFENGLWIPDGM